VAINCAGTDRSTARTDGESHVEEFHSLAGRDLERGQGIGLPSGEAVARRLDETPLSRDEIGAARVGWHGETPLWLTTGGLVWRARD
jgi:hypothetical protein